MIERELHDRAENVHRIDYRGTVQEWARAEWAKLRDMDEISEPQVEWFATFLRADMIPSPRALELARHDARCARLMREIARTPLFDPLPPLLYPAATLRKFMLHDLPNA
jgi:hypothetical protein